MTNYSYHTSQKSYLDLMHDDLWNNIALFIAKWFPWVTPNMVTLSGFLPICAIFFLFMSGMIGDIAYLLMFPAMIFYLNMDAVDGKLARATNRSSPFGQMLDHGCDAIAVGMISLMLSYMGTLDFLSYDSYLFRFIIFVSVYASYGTVLMCNITEFYTGGMVVSVGPISTTEISYLISLLFISAYCIRNSFMVLLFDLGRYLLVGASISNSLILFNDLMHINTNEKKKGTEKNMVHFNVNYIQHFLLTMVLGGLTGYLTDFSILQTSLCLIYIGSSLIDIIYSNSMKYNVIHFDYVTLILQCFKCFVGLLFGFGYITYIIDVLALVQTYSNKIDKRDHIFKQQAKTDSQ